MANSRNVNKPKSTELPPLLEELRAALHEKIEVLKEDSSFQPDLSTMMRKLIGLIESKASASRSIAPDMPGKETIGETSTETPDKLGLYPSRELALQRALGRNLTVTWGVPRTGKTLSLGIITEQLYNSGRTILIISHTSSALDRAIKQVAKPLQNYLPQGVVIRVGEIKDSTLRTTYPEVLVEQQVEHQSLELLRHRARLVAEKEKLVNELGELEKSIAIVKWLESSGSHVQLARVKIEQLHQLESQLSDDEKTWTELKLQQPRLFELQGIISRILTLRSEQLNQRDKQSVLNEQISGVISEIDKAQTDLQQQQFRVKLADRIGPMRIERAAYPSVDEQKAVFEDLASKVTRFTIAFEEIQRRYNLANKLLSQINNTSVLGRMLKHLPKPEEQRAIVNELFTQLSASADEKKSVTEAYNVAKNKLSRILELDTALLGHEDIGSKNEELTKQLNCENSLHDLEERKSKLDSDFENLSKKIKELEEEEKKLTASLDGDPEVMGMEVEAKLQVHKDLQVSIVSKRFNSKQLREDVNMVLDRLLSQLSVWMTIDPRTVSEEEKWDYIKESYQELESEHKSAELPSLLERADLLRWGVDKFISDMAAADEKLARVESDVIRNASIIGATLTDIYLSDIVQARRFDTVIVDEISTDPVLTLWVAALLAERNLIIIGDFK